MMDRKPRLELSRNEIERRERLIKDRLKRAGLSAIIVYGGTQLGVPLHYLTGLWGMSGNLLLFPVDGNPAVFLPTNRGMTVEQAAREGCWLSSECIRFSANPVVDAAKEIMQLGLEKSEIGIDSFRFWPVFEYQTFSELCPHARLTEAHRLFGEIRGPKSEEELAEIQKAIGISNLAHYIFLNQLVPGVTEIEASAKAEATLVARGAGDRIILIHSKPELVYPYRPTLARIEMPDPVTFSPEFSRQIGYGAQMIRAYWWEKPKGVYERMFDLWAAMRQMIVEEFRPGVEITEAGRKIEKLVDQWGFECDKLGHALGISYGDAPYITAGPGERDYMAWTILENEVYAVHPMVRAKGGKPPFTMIGDMYLVGKDATRWMTTALPGLPEMIPG
jgi:Xaa-Pro aminopeptidase